MTLPFSRSQRLKQLFGTWNSFGLAALVLLAVGACGSETSAPQSKPTASPTRPTKTSFEFAMLSCKRDISKAPSSVSLEDQGHTLVIDTENDFDYQGSEAAWCVIDFIHPSKALSSQIEHTNSLMGQQDETEGNFRYRWSYHPDNGLDMTITDTATTTP